MLIEVIWLLFPFLFFLRAYLNKKYCLFAITKKRGVERCLDEADIKTSLLS